MFSGVDSATTGGHPKNAQKVASATKQTQQGKPAVPNPAGAKSGVPAPHKVRKQPAAAAGGAGIPSPQGETATKDVTRENERVTPPIKSKIIVPIVQI